MPVETSNDTATIITPRRSAIQADADCMHLAAELEECRSELRFAQVEIIGLEAQNLELRRIISSAGEAMR